MLRFPCLNLRFRKSYHSPARQDVAGTILVIVFLLSTAGCAGIFREPITEQERKAIETKLIPELESEIKSVEKRREHRRSFGGLGDVIGTNSTETFSSRYSSEIHYYSSILSALKKELESGEKVKPPARFRKSRGYYESKYKKYFKE